jgi:hypothetical protein
LHVADNNSNVDRARQVKDSVMKASQFKQPTDTTQDKWLVSIIENFGYDLGRMRTAMSKSMRNSGGNLQVQSIL